MSLFKFHFQNDDERGQAFAALQIWHRRSLYFWIGLAFAILVFSCDWANIFGEADSFSNYSSQWQSCLTQTQYVTVPLNSSVEQLYAIANTTLVTTNNCIKAHTTVTDLLKTTCLADSPTLNCLLLVKGAANPGQPCECML